MKTLIISMTCGEGHNQIAKAIKNSLDLRGEECKIVQLYGFSDKATQKQNKMFLRACKYIPHLYGAVWERMRKKPFKGYMKGVVKDCRDYILQEINEYNPATIVCTHNNAGAVVGQLKKEGLINSSVKTYTIVFDYCLCPYWETNSNLDYAVLPHEDLIDDMKKKGFKENQLLALGLPVDEKFTKVIEKDIVREELGLAKDKFTVVLYSGGNCLSSAYKIIRKLLKCSCPIQIIAICGRNEKEYNIIEKLIEKKGITNIKNIGFCTYLDKVFSAGDVVFSRGGGMGLTEQLNKHIPFILREKLIINEKINKYYFAHKVLGIAMKKLSNAPKIIEDLVLVNPEILKVMSSNAEKYCKPNSTADLVNHILQK